MNDRDERPSDVLADEREQQGDLPDDLPGVPLEDAAAAGTDDDPTAGASDIGGRAGEPDDPGER